LPIALELAESSLKLLANLASPFSIVAGTLPVIFFLSCWRMTADFKKVGGVGRIYVGLPATFEKVLANWLASFKKVGGLSPATLENALASLPVTLEESVANLPAPLLNQRLTVNWPRPIRKKTL
jgi:hypothetical protein